MMDKKIRKRFGKIGILLPGGGTRAAFGAGALIPFSKHGIVPDYVCSVSSGTLNALGYVASQNSAVPAKMWKKIIHGPSDIWTKNPINQGRYLSDIAQETAILLSGGGSRIDSIKRYIRVGLRLAFHLPRIWKTPHLLSPDPLMEGLRREVDMNEVFQSSIEWEIVCTNKATQKEVFFSNRQITNPDTMFDIVQASFSIPGIFPEIKINGQVYVDGSPSLAIDRAVKKHGCNTIFIVCVHPVDEKFEYEGSKQIFFPVQEAFKNYMTYSGSHISRYENDMIRIAKTLSTHTEIYVIRPTRLPTSVETLFINARERDLLIGYGKRSTEKLLAKLIPTS